MKWIVLLLAATFAVAAANSAKAQEKLKVGQAEIVRNEVMSVGSAEPIPVSVGDDIMRDEVIQTNADSDAKIILLDNTKLAVGPGSTLKIDRAVYSGEARYREVVIRMTDGAFRFVTGKSDKKSYKIETPFATIGVRGTILDIRIAENQTLVSLQEGEASVCASGQCTQLLQKGHTANVTRTGNVTKITRDLVPTWTFASVCSGNKALCEAIPSNPLRRATLPEKPEKLGSRSAITRFCPNGQIEKNGSCVGPLLGDGDQTLPGLDALKNSRAGPISPSTVQPDVTPPALATQPSNPSSRVQIPGFRR